jgi:hypothetical protein
VVRTGSGSYTMVGFAVNSVEPPDSATRGS